MRITVSAARGRLGELCGLAQDPRQPIIFTRHGRDIAALVSMEEVKRIWTLQTEDWGPRNPLTGRKESGALVLPEGMTTGTDGRIITLREAAQQVWRIQMGRADERRMLEAGGLPPVEGGELMVEVPCAVPVEAGTGIGSDDGSERPILRAGPRAEGVEAPRVSSRPSLGGRWFGWLWRSARRPGRPTGSR